ncbi:hypothetical protein [Desulfocurvibacter africanus]|uniref:hypothetical protein n=1 Tax=Desulfocurvibacter africanus TaxID=873 RepID=UPI00126834E6|nr:hypothetical protein [Desulfocurvibacter africanus]
MSSAFTSTEWFARNLYMNNAECVPDCIGEEDSRFPPGVAHCVPPKVQDFLSQERPMHIPMIIRRPSTGIRALFLLKMLCKPCVGMACRQLRRRRNSLAPSTPEWASQKQSALDAKSACKLIEKSVLRFDLAMFGASPTFAHGRVAFFTPGGPPWQ